MKPEVVNSRNIENHDYSFSKQLQFQYEELALRKNAEDNAASATHFADKAADAAAGRRVMPDRPGDDESRQVYDRLSGALSGATPERMPAERARAQVMYDCWLEERVQNVDADDIAACARQFERAMLVLDGDARMRGQVQQ